MQNVKCVVVGDGAVGKTCILIVYTRDEFPTDYVPTIFDNYSTNVMVDAQPVNLGLWDTAGQEDFDRLRPLSYPSTDVFLVCFDCTARNSFENVKSKWCPELSHHVADAPQILVATKTDLRDENPAFKNEEASKGNMFVTKEEALELVDEMKMAKYMETSALKKMGLTELFEEAVRVALKKKNDAKTNQAQARNKKKKKSNCCLL